MLASIVGANSMIVPDLGIRKAAAVLAAVNSLPAPA